jgi:hypothetical protein
MGKNQRKPNEDRIAKTAGASTRHVKTRPAYPRTMLNYTQLRKILCLSRNLRRMTFVIVAK